MTEKRFTKQESTIEKYMLYDNNKENAYFITCDEGTINAIVDLLNEQQEFIEELQVSDEMGWKRAEHFEKKCPKELHNKKIYIKRLEYKVQKFKEMNGEQQTTINKQKKRIIELEQRDYDNQSERYKILGRAIELTINYIANSDEEHYNIGALITEFENELLEGLNE